ncbi:hypothetical protein CK203_087479 [Vitis vinifera]|uniref:Integrase catalytic domain-containing protein n=1 Tax=Vitis vinifera TaxID=29760 RepID=A0A438ENF3_VITVI|nr:hypothetical protein CK203_087479 [Vitis vinifera]
MREVHAGVSGPHMRGHMLARKIMRIGYFWLTMETDCCQFVQRCPECQIYGDLIHVPSLELHVLASPWPFSVWSIDIIGKISPKSSSGYEFILVAIDYFTKVDVDTLLQRYGIQQHRSFVYKPQTNGAVETANKNIKRILRRMVETSQDWPEKLFFALELTLESAAWLMDLDANRFSEPTNIDQLKRRSEPPSLFSLAFRATISSQFGVQSHHLFSIRAFRATISSQFGVKSHHLLVARRSEPSSLLATTFRVILLSLTFRATISLQLGVQGHHRFSVTTFKVVFLSLTFGSHISSLVFGVTILSSLTFKAIILSWPGIHSHIFSVQSYVPSIQSWPLSSVLGVQSHVFSLAFRATIFFSLTFRAVSSL